MNRTLFGVRGGVHPDDRKECSLRAPIRPSPLPPQLVVSLQQHIGASARPVVRVGERVLKGQLIAVRQGNVSANLHAPTSGRVIAIGDFPAPHPSGLTAPAIIIEADGEERWVDLQTPADPFSLAPEEIAARVEAAGIVGLGGAQFPAAVKLIVSRKNGVHTLIINGSECEPYLTCDDRLMQERAAEIADGIRLLQHALQVRTVFVAIECNKPAAIAAMRAVAHRDFSVVELPVLYPTGWEKGLVRLVTGLEIPAGGRAADIGILVHNVATAYAIQQAVTFGRPLISRVVTVSGQAVRDPGNVEALIGTPLSMLLEACGGLQREAVRYVLGGPMMGLALPHLSLPLIKGSGGLLALTAQEVHATSPGPCIRCSRCVRACPVGLLPLEMAARIRVGDLDAAVALGLTDCIGCGSCAYVCPAHIPLSHYFDHAKGALVERERARLKREATKRLASARAARLERQARERAAAAQSRASRAQPKQQVAADREKEPAL
ncbi:MAG: electron transport complex subunit RsxC [Hydrogenophilus sp.]|nr:electron transport complex subunit RsxC [Hydrogenophilus sp.]